MTTTEQVRAKLRECYDPELPCNIVDLGLVYGVALDGERATVTMTLTARTCPLARQITAQVRQKLLELPGISEAEVELVFDPPWDESRISDEGRRQLRLR
ncbi:MAG: metal-sulfur cluster assembly factor [Verrucomicrobia bacterium]|nr:metal-sulfur cluster assembly factor [Verrucomicrobiota bacterium]